MNFTGAARVLLAMAMLAGVATHATEPITPVETIDGIPGLPGATDVVVSPDGAHVYVVSVLGDSVVMFARDAGTNALTSLGFLEDGVGGVEGLGAASRIAISPDGAHVYVASGDAVFVGDDALAVFERDPGTGLLTEIQVLEQGVGGVDGLAAPTSLVVAPDGGHVYVGRGQTEVPERGPAVFDRDPVTGLLTFVEVTAGMPSFALALSPDGADLYAASASGDLVVAARDANTGLLTHVQTIATEGALGTFGTFPPGGIAVSGDGRHVYYAGQSDFSDLPSCCHPAIAAFERNAADGSLVLEGLHKADLGAALGPPRLTSDGLVVVVGGNPPSNQPGSSGGGASARNPATGAATLWAANSPIRGRIAISPDDRGIYGASTLDLEVGTLGACRPLAISTKLSFTNVGPDPADDRFVMKGKASLPGVGVPDLALDVTGLRLVLDTYEGGVGSSVSDDTIPGGLFAGGGTAGWVKKRGGAIWLYLDKTGTPINGITKIKIQDRSSSYPNEVGIKLIAKRGGSYPVGSGLTVARLELGAPERCLLTGDASCTENASSTKVICKSVR